MQWRRGAGFSLPTPCLVEVEKISRNFFGSLTTNLEYQIKSNYKTTSTTPCKSRDKSNEVLVFDRLIRGWLLLHHCSKSSINYHH